jgi:hypothetical protein
LSRPNWSRPLPRPPKIPTVTTLKTLAMCGSSWSVICRPSGHKRDTWRHVATCLSKAASGGNINDAVVSLRLVLQLERVPCLPQ